MHGERVHHKNSKQFWHPQPATTPAAVESCRGWPINEIDVESNINQILIPNFDTWGKIPFYS